MPPPPPPPREADRLYETREIPGYGIKNSGYDAESGQQYSSGWLKLRKIGVLFIPAWATYSLVLIVCGLSPIFSRFLAVLSIVTFFLAAGWFVWSEHRILKYSGVLCLLAVASGVSAGYHLEQKYFVPYFKYQNGPVYTDVQPSDPANSRADGAIINFNDRALVDTFKTGIFRAGDGTKFCAAPIFDESQQNRAEFWAVGTNCCERQISFYCDDSADFTFQWPKALVVYDTDTPFSFPEYKSYIRAVNESTASNALQIPKDPVLVRWKHTPRHIIDAFLVFGLLYIAAHVVFGFCACAGGGSLLYVIADLNNAPAEIKGLPFKIM